jgi:hypothetical protein
MHGRECRSSITGTSNCVLSYLLQKSVLCSSIRKSETHYERRRSRNTTSRDCSIPDLRACVSQAPLRTPTQKTHAGDYGCSPRTNVRDRNVLRRGLLDGVHIADMRRR